MTQPLNTYLIHENSRSLLLKPSLSKKKAVTSAVKNGLKFIISVIVEVSGYIFLGLAMSAIYPPLAMPLYVFAAAAAVGKFVLLAVKAIDPYHIRHLNKLRKAADILTAKCPKLPVIACIFTIAINLISQSAGCAVAGILGFISAVFISAKNRQAQDLALTEQQSSDIMTY